MTPPLKKALLWAALAGCSLLAGLVLHYEGFPAAFLVGAIVAAIGFSLRGIRLRLPRPYFVGAQALIGCSVAESFSASILLAILDDWLPMALIVGTTVIAGGMCGWLLVRYRVLPGTTAAWGSSPGAAAAMVAMADDYGADARLVALMQYLRVLVVVLSASLVAHLVAGPEGMAVAAAQPTPADWMMPLVAALGSALAGALIGQWFRIPAGALVLPMLIGGALQVSGLAHVHEPYWLKAGASLLLGWQVGLAFDRASLIAALRLVPRLLLSTLLLIGLCAVSAFLLVRLVEVDPLTAYLATSPGGLDSMILIAMGSQVDAPFVVAVQTLRLFVVVLTGPLIARLISRSAPDQDQG